MFRLKCSASFCFRLQFLSERAPPLAENHPSTTPTV